MRSVPLLISTWPLVPSALRSHFGDAPVPTITSPRATVPDVASECESDSSACGPGTSPTGDGASVGDGAAVGDGGLGGTVGLGAVVALGVAVAVASGVGVGRSGPQADERQM